MNDFNFYGIGDTYTTTEYLIAQPNQLMYGKHPSEKKKRIRFNNLNTILYIQYLDKNNDLTQRKIRLKSLFEGYNGLYFIKAHCYLRNAERIFNCKRIQQIKTLNGEIVTVNDLMNQFKKQRFKRKK